MESTITSRGAEDSSAIAGWQRRIREAVEGAARLLAEVPAERWNAAPTAPGEEWTAARHLEHLCVVAGLVADKIETALDRDVPPRGNPDDWRPGWFSRWFIAACGPQPAGKRTPAPALFLPGDGPFDPAALRERLFATHARLTSLIGRCADVDVSRVSAPSAATPLLRLNLGTWFEAMATHTAYHAARAEALVR